MIYGDYIGLYGKDFGVLLFWGVECCCCPGPLGSKLFCWAFGILVSVLLPCRASMAKPIHLAMGWSQLSHRVKYLEPGKAQSCTVLAGSVSL